MKDATGLRTSSRWPTETDDHRARQDRQWFVDRETIESAKAELLSPTERQVLLAQLGAIIEPWLDAKLEAKALELIERRQVQLTRVWGDTQGNGDLPRESLLCTREQAAQMLGVSLSTIKRMEGAGELPEPIKLSERRVAHRVIDIEKIAKFKGKAMVSGSE